MFIQEYFSKWVTSKAGIYVVIISYLIMIGISAYGSTKVIVDFKPSYILPGNSPVRNYVEKQEKHFQSNDAINIITDGELDFTKEET